MPMSANLHDCTEIHASDLPGVHQYTLHVSAPGNVSVACFFNSIEALRAALVVALTETHKMIDAEARAAMAAEEA